jgi:hypothetical protein
LLVPTSLFSLVYLSKLGRHQYVDLRLRVQLLRIILPRTRVNKGQEEGTRLLRTLALKAICGSQVATVCTLLHVPGLPPRQPRLGALEERLDVVPVGVDDEGGIVVGVVALAQARGPVVTPPTGEGCGPPCRGV